MILMLHTLIIHARSLVGRSLFVLSLPFSDLLLLLLSRASPILLFTSGSTARDATVPALLKSAAQVPGRHARVVDTCRCDGVPPQAMHKARLQVLWHSCVDEQVLEHTHHHR